MSKSLILLLLLFTACVAQMPRSDTTIVEERTPAIGSDGTVIEAVGLETLGGVFTPLLEVGCSVPCEVSEIFSTAVDNQDQVTISLYRGSASMVANATHLGEFRITGIPPMGRGEPQVEVTLAARGNDLILEAKELSSSRPYKIVLVED